MMICGSKHDWPQVLVHDPLFGSGLFIKHSSTCSVKSFLSAPLLMTIQAQYALTHAIYTTTPTECPQSGDVDVLDARCAHN